MNSPSPQRRRVDAEGAEDFPAVELTERVIGAAIEVHRELGPGLLESAYQRCLAIEMTAKGIAYERERPVAIVYRGTTIDEAYRLDFLVEKQLVVEVKSVAALEPIHEAQVLTYLRAGQRPVGLLLNFNAAVLKRGIKRLARTRAGDLGLTRRRLL